MARLNKLNNAPWLGGSLTDAIETALLKAKADAITDARFEIIPTRASTRIIVDDVLAAMVRDLRARAKRAARGMR